MSKSLNNTILLSDDPETVKAKLKKAKTDPQKIRKGDPGHPDICLVFSYHKKFNSDEIKEIESGCKSGELGCFDCKMNCADKISAVLAPIIEKRKYYESNLDLVKDVLSDGENAAKLEAQKTMNDVREKMKLG